MITAGIGNSNFESVLYVIISYEKRVDRKLNYEGLWAELQNFASMSVQIFHGL